MSIVQIGHHCLKTQINITKGVLQGDPMSSTLFNLFMADLDVKMKQASVPQMMSFHTKLELNYLLFADDIILIAENRLYLQKLLNKVQDYFLENKLQVNENKTKIMIFKKGGLNRKLQREHFTIAGERLDRVKEYKYLGVTFHATGKFHATAKSIVNKAKQKIDAMWPTLMRAKFPKFKNVLLYLDSVILPKVMYSAQIWALDQTQILEQVQTHFLRKLLAIYPPRAANYFLRLELERSHILYRLFSLAIKFHHKLHIMQNFRLPKILLTVGVLRKSERDQNPTQLVEFIHADSK